MLSDVGHDLVAAGQRALHWLLDWKRRVFAGKLQDLVDGAEKFFRIFGRDLLRRLRRCELWGGLCGAGAFDGGLLLLNR